ncbi:MAG: hypothetical protein WDK96_01180 [Candidatus Paceibacterota bacterium]|jgi:hypothetical protein
MIKERKILDGLKVDYSLSADELLTLLKKFVKISLETENYLRHLILAEEEKGHKRNSHRNLHLLSLKNNVGFYQLDNLGKGQSLGQVSIHEAIFAGINHGKSGIRIFPFINTIHLVGKPIFFYFSFCPRNGTELKTSFSYGSNQELTKFLFAGN